jgi:hypothetical protein
VQRALLKNSRKCQRTPQFVPQGNRKQARSQRCCFAQSSAGDDEAVPLAIELAHAVLDASEAKIAQSVLDGGPLTLTRAIRLAELVLTGRSAAGKVGVL